MASRPDLAALLVARKVATARQVERLHGDVPLWRAALDAEIVDEDALFELLRDHGGVSVAPEALIERVPSRDALAPLISHEEALRSGLLPLELSADGRRAQIAMVDPTDEKTLRAVAQNAGFQSAKVFLMKHAELTAVIERAYAQRSTVEPAGKVGQRSELEAAERLEQVLVQASLSLGAALESQLARGLQGPSPREAARLAREVARELGHDRRRIALAGLAAQLIQLDELYRARTAADDHDLSLFDEIGWAAGGDDGLLGIARALTAQAAGFQRPANAGATQRVVQAVIDYLGIVAVEGGAHEGSRLDTTLHVLRTSNAGAPVVDALLRVLRRDASARTPAHATALPDAPEATDRHTAIAPRRTRNEDATQVVALPKASSSTPHGSRK